MTLLSARKLVPALVALAAMSAGPVGAAVPVGATKVVVRTVTGTLGETVRTLVVQDRVSQNEIIATKADSASQIVFEDSTTLTLGPNAEVTLDKFVYDPNPSKGKFFLTFTQGIMRFITGTLDHSAYSIKTPNGTIGVRGTNIYAAVSCTGAVCSTSLGSLQGTAVFTDNNGVQTVIGPGGFANFGGGAAGGSTGGGANLRADVLAGLAAALDQVAYAQTGLGGAGGGGGNNAAASPGGGGNNAPASSVEVLSFVNTATAPPPP
jgi:FecR protein